MAESRDELIKRLEREALMVRRNSWRALKASGGGHVGGSVSAAEMFAALYFYKMNVRSDDPDWADRDRFVLSKGHANAGLSAVLAQKGFFPDAWLDTFYGYESLLGMHPDIKCPGVEMSTGGLGHGLPIGVGMAMGARIQGKSFQTYVMTGDGELHEGSNWEAAMAAAQYRLNNLTCIVDANRVSQSAHVADLVGIEPLADKWRAFGWEVRECDGHSMADVVKTLDELPFNLQKPSLIISHTVKGKGVSFAEDTYLWHSNTVNEEILQKALAELGTP
jgi:transketolase